MVFLKTTEVLDIDINKIVIKIFFQMSQYTMNRTLHLWWIQKELQDWYQNKQWRILLKWVNMQWLQNIFPKDSGFYDIDLKKDKTALIANRCIYTFNSMSSFHLFVNSYRYFISLVWFFGMSNIVGYLMPNPHYTYILSIYDLVLVRILGI